MFEESNLKSKRILVVQQDFVDEMKIAMEFRAGGLAADMDLTEQTMVILEGSDIGAAIFDRDLDLDKSVQIADAFAALGIPFVFANADEIQVLPERLMAFSFAESSAELQLIANQFLGRPTYH